MAERELVRHLRWVVGKGVAPTLVMAFLYGLLAVYLPSSFLPRGTTFQSVIIPHLGGFFMSFLVPFAVANLFCVKGVVAITSDLVGMRESQEIDVLDALGLDVVQELFAPRALALVLPAPFLAVLAMGAGSFGAWLGTLLFLKIGLGDFWRAFLMNLSLETCLVAVAKTTMVAFVMSIVAGAHAFSPVSPGEREPIALLTTAAVGVATLSVTVLNLLFRIAFS